MGGLFSLLVYFNVKLAAHAPRSVRFLVQDQVIELPSTEIIDPLVQALILPAALVLGVFAAPHAAGQWEAFLLFVNGVPFGLADPLFGHDLGFYVFRLPALATLYGWLSFALGLTLLVTAVTYFLYRGSSMGVWLCFPGNLAKNNVPDFSNSRTESAEPRSRGHDRLICAAVEERGVVAC